MPHHSQTVELIAVRKLKLIESAVPELAAAQQAHRDEAWEKALAANSTLFDGYVPV